MDELIRGSGGEPIVLPLTVGAATGYRWQLDLPPGVQRLDDEPVDAPVRPGADPGAHLRVQAEPGEYTVGAKLIRPWEPDKVAKSATFRLAVD